MKSIASPVPDSFLPEADAPCRKPHAPRKPRTPGRVGLPLLVLLGAAIVPAPPPGAAHLMHLPDLCPFRVMTGLPCPGCGMTRALACIAHGHFADSWGFHPLGWAVFAAFVGFAAIRLFRLPVSFSPRAVNFLSGATIAVLLLVWAARLTHYLPYPP